MYFYHQKEILKTIEFHYTNWSNTGRQETLLTNRDQVLDALSDCLYKAPTMRVAQIHAQRNGARRAASGTSTPNTYVFVFSHQTPAWDHSSLPTGAVTGEEIPYIFGYPLWKAEHMNELPYVGVYTPDDKTISEAMMRYVSNFVISGYAAFDCLCLSFLDFNICI